MAHHPLDNEQRHPKVAPSEPINTTPNHEDPPEDNPPAGLVPVPCQCWLCRWYRAADKAIALGGAVRLEGSHTVTVVADVVVAEVVANGGEIAETYRLIREDGRSVYVFIDEEPAA